jgi:enterochelin esterase-like enzyme
MNQLITKRLIGPMILVMPTISAGHDYQECINAPGALDDTYVTQDVRADIQAHFRVSAIAAEWGIAGYSSGGYCAANLALRHPTDFGASEIMALYQVPGAGHNFYAWEPAVPYLLQWMWSQLTPPQLRVQFPLTGSVRTSTINLPADIRAAVKAGTHPAKRKASTVVHVTTGTSTNA